MRSAQEWLDTYAQSHQHPTNKALHWICVPAIVVSLIGMLAAIPVPPSLEPLQAASPFLHWGTVFLVTAMAYYLVLSPALAAGMILPVAAILLLVEGLAALPAPLALSSLGVFVVAWVGQFIGHQIEGQRPSFFQDVQFLMIGPLWILAAVYRRAGWSY